MIINIWPFIHWIRAASFDAASPSEHPQESLIDMLTPKKLSRLFLRLVILVFFVSLALFIVSPPSFVSDTDEVVTCVGNGHPFFPPTVDGLVMDKDIQPSQWKSFDSAHTNLTDRRIFFHETSGNAQLNFQQCCAVESAAKHNPDRPVQLFLRPFATDCPFHSESLLFQSPPWLDVLSRYPNVDVILVNEDRYFAGTPLQDWYEKGEWLKSQHKVAHLSDYIRILTLYKGGGLYLDTDILTLKTYQGDKFRNCLVYGSGRMGVFSNGVMHLERGHWLSAEIIRLLAEEYDKEAYAYHGPAVVSEVMGRMCGVVAGHSNSNHCEDVKLLSDRFFYPIEAPFSHVIFNDHGNKTDKETLIKIRKSYGLHLWNSLSYVHQPVRIDSNQIFSVLARQHCPHTVTRAADFPMK
jgi:hypothetical protein